MSTDPKVRVGVYLWRRNQEVPGCDSCYSDRAYYKIHSDDVGIRLCEVCAEHLYYEMGKEGIR